MSAVTDGKTHACSHGLSHDSELLASLSLSCSWLSQDWELLASLSLICTWLSHNCDLLTSLSLAYPGWAKTVRAPSSLSTGMCLAKPWIVRAASFLITGMCLAERRQWGLLWTTYTWFMPCGGLSDCHHNKLQCTRCSSPWHLGWLCYHVGSADMTTSVSSTDTAPSPKTGVPDKWVPGWSAVWHHQV